MPIIKPVSAKVPAEGTPMIVPDDMNIVGFYRDAKGELWLDGYIVLSPTGQSIVQRKLFVTDRDAEQELAQPGQSEQEQTPSQPSQP